MAQGDCIIQYNTVHVLYHNPTAHAQRSLQTTLIPLANPAPNPIGASDALTPASLVHCMYCIIDSVRTVVSSMHAVLLFFESLPRTAETSRERDAWTPYPIPAYARTVCVFPTCMDLVMTGYTLI